MTLPLLDDDGRIAKPAEPEDHDPERPDPEEEEER